MSITPSSASPSDESPRRIPLAHPPSSDHGDFFQPDHLHNPSQGVTGSYGGKDSIQLEGSLSYLLEDSVQESYTASEGNDHRHLAPGSHSSHSGGLSSTFHQSHGDFASTVRRKYNGQRNLTTASFSSNGNLRGRKGPTQSANHLLNFHYDPIPRAPRPQARNFQPRKQPKIKPYNKDLFLQANFRFLVSDMGDYILNSSNPDKMLDWDNVVSVNLSSNILVQCPICLETPPLCPQITTCGHIFCFPCVLRFLMMGEEDYKGYHWKKCPICSNMISCKDLYTVCITDVNEYNTKDNINFTLLTRAKNSVIPFEKDQFLSDALPYSTNGQCNPFSKFTLTSEPGLIAKKTIFELSSWIEKVECFGGEDVELLPYVYAARDLLNEREKSWKEKQNLEQHSNSPPGKQFGVTDLKTGISKINLENCNSSEHRIGTEQQPASSKGSELPKDVKSLDPSIKTDDTDLNDVESYTFYQSVDGQLIMLHPLNMKCLLHHFGSHDLLPARISGKILELETISQSDSSRKRYRYLSHLPLTTIFKLCEIDLGEVLPPSAFLPFMDEIEKRRSERHRRWKKEIRSKEKAPNNAATDLKLTTTLHSGAISIDKPPSSDDFEVLGEPKIVSTSPPTLEGRRLFSAVTKLGFASGHDSPNLISSQLGGLQEPIASCSSSAPIASCSSSDNAALVSEPMETVAGTSKPAGMSFVDAITTAKSKEQGCNSQLSKGNNPGKKGKKNTKVLLSTAGERRY